MGGCYAWQADELKASLHFVDWMGSVQMKFSFSGDTVRIVAKENYRQQPIAFTGLREPAPDRQSGEGPGKSR